MDRVGEGWLTWHERTYLPDMTSGPRLKGDRVDEPSAPGHVWCSVVICCFRNDSTYLGIHLPNG